MAGADLEKFQRAIAKAGVGHIKPALDRDQNALGEAIYADLFDLPQTPALPGPTTAQDRFVGQVFHGFMEIYRSYERLQDIYFYAGRFPYSGTKITAERYLRYHIENYFSEVYVLQQRLLAYLKAIERLYRKEVDFSEIKNSCANLTDVVTKGLEAIVNTRGSHVHQRRFTDNQLSRLGTIEVVINVSADDKEFAKVLRSHFKGEHRKVKTYWKKQLKQGNDGMTVLLDMVFGKLYPFMFDANSSEFRFPRRMATNNRLQRTPASGRR